MNSSDSLSRALIRAVLLATGAVVALWFLHQILFAILFIVVAVILTLALNPPVVWLEKRKIPRVAATLLVFAALLGIVGGLGALVVPRIAPQISGLIAQIPEYGDQLRERANTILDPYPELQKQLPLRRDGSIRSDSAQQLQPLLETLATRVGNLSLSVLGALVLALLLFSTVLYALAQPRPLIAAYLHAFPPHLRPNAERALAKSAVSVSGWLWSNLIIGTIEAVAAAIFLTIIGVPGALVWALLTFFAELVPQIGPYLMAVPPTLVALADEPSKALWVVLFYIALTQVAGSFLAPLVRSKQMKLHPLSLTFAVLAFGLAFGVLGALIATPLTGFCKAFYEEFYANRLPEDSQQSQRIEAVLEGRSEDTSAPNMES